MFVCLGFKKKKKKKKKKKNGKIMTKETLSMCHEPSANLSLCANEVEDVLNDQKKKRQKKDEGEGPLNR